MTIDKEITPIDTRLVYENKWMKVREDKIIRKDGSKGIYGVVEKKDFVVIVPFLDSDKMILVEQYRYPVEGRHWEFPQGSWEEVESEPEQLARAELEEETGYIAGEIKNIGHLFVAYGYSTQGYHIFLANELIKSATKLDPEEVGLISNVFTISDVEKMILDQKIKDATTVAVFGLLKMKGIVG